MNSVFNRHSDEADRGNAEVISDGRCNYALTSYLEVSLGRSHRDKYDVLCCVRIVNYFTQLGRVYVVERLFAMQEFGPCLVGEDRTDFIVQPCPNRRWGHRGLSTTSGFIVFR